MCVFKLFVLIVLRVATLNTPRMEVAVVVVLIITIGLGQLHDGLGVGVHGRERDLRVVRSPSLSKRPASAPSTRYSWIEDAAADADGVEPERAEERQARPLEAPVARVPGAAERHNNSDEAVGRNLVPPCPPRFVLAPHPRHHAGLAVAHELQSCESSLAGRAVLVLYCNHRSC